MRGGEPSDEPGASYDLGSSATTAPTSSLYSAEQVMFLVSLS